MSAEGSVEHLQYFGHRTEYAIRVGDALLQAWAPNETRPDVAIGQNVTLHWRRDNVVLFEGAPR